MVLDQILKGIGRWAEVIFKVYGMGFGGVGLCYILDQEWCGSGCVLLVLGICNEIYQGPMV